MPSEEYPPFDQLVTRIVSREVTMPVTPTPYRWRARYTGSGALALPDGQYRLIVPSNDGSFLRRWLGVDPFSRVLQAVQIEFGDTDAAGRVLLSSPDDVLAEMPTMIRGTFIDGRTFLCDVTLTPGEPTRALWDVTPGTMVLTGDTTTTVPLATKLSTDLLGGPPAMTTETVTEEVKFWMGFRDFTSRQNSISNVSFLDVAPSRYYVRERRGITWKGGSRFTDAEGRGWIVQGVSRQGGRGKVGRGGILELTATTLEDPGEN